MDDLAFDLDLVAVCLQAGLPVGRALEHATRAAGDRSGLGQIARAARWGLDDLRWEETTGGAAGDGVAGESPAARALASVVAVIRFSARTGVALAPLLQSHADELRRGEHRRRQIAAARLGVMLVLPLGVCVLPAFVLLGVVPVLLTLVSGLGPAFGGV
ncbi:MAG TPA: type II secretion system F family protein [Candidatus Brevibacterium intestinigallinarum]|uniref:type II secretion system F family protein n=1 Tax=Brevibacterium senegalense TaxID=1033736 RepID=UPI0002E190CC|nr:type II secretion system F family protein [Brevibacterium senegalense]HJA39065.1 type II secretion system F family protein [Candidatus Brevibacterium intestinigallinarum]